MTGRASTVRSRVLDSHRGTLGSLIDAGRTVAASWAGEATTEAAAVRDPLEDRIREQGLDGALLEMLRGGVDALGTDATGRPVPAPPYVVVTSRGPLCRATVTDGCRVVIAVELFEVDREGPSYRFLDPDIGGCLAVRIK